MKILIVEDEQKIADGIDCILHKQKLFACHTRISVNGLEAVTVSKLFHPDMVITDIRMQMMNGLDMIKEMHKENIHAQFIIISGYSNFEYAQTAIRYHVLDYLLKPVDKERLLELAYQIYISLPQNYSKFSDRKLPDIQELNLALSLDTYPPSLKKVILYMQKNYMRDISLQTIADELMLHSCYISTLINTHTSNNFSYLLNKIRIRKACEFLLFEQDLSVDNISYLVGYNNVRRLYHAFQQLLNTTPGDFREKWIDTMEH